MPQTQLLFKSIVGEKSMTHLKANVWYSENTLKPARPVALYFHGGGYIVGSKDDIPPTHVEMLLERGFVVVSPDYRLCPTISAPDGPIRDCMDCYSWVQSALPDRLREIAGIEVDPMKVVALGGSCGGSLAHFMSQMPRPPSAIVDFAGMKYLSDPHYHSPSAMAEHLPDFEKAFIDKIWAEVPPPTATPWPFGPNEPDCSQPRFCWMYQASKEGSLYKQLVTGGDTTCIDPAPAFSRKDYPSTCIVNGSDDLIVDVRFARRAYEDIKAGGAECELLIAEGLGHAFEADVKSGEAGFDTVQRAFDFLASHVK